MRLYYTYIFFLVFTSCGLDQSNETYSHSKDDIETYNLIDPTHVFELLTDDNQWIVVHVSKKEGYQKGHLPNALNIWRPDYGSDVTEPYGGLIPSREKLEKLLQSFGYQKGKHLLIYDAKGNVDALRFAWVLNLYGFDDFKVINGGLKYWKELNLPISKEETPLPEPSQYVLPPYFNESIIANNDDVSASINDDKIILVDTREEYEYKGRPYVHKGQVIPFKKGAFDRGSIPGSVHLNWSILADLNGDHRIKSEKDLRYDLESRGITPDKKIILYCHSGSRTSHTFYVLKHVLGYENVQNYDGSWIEWSYLATNNPNIPTVKITTEEEFETYKDSLIINLSSHGQVL